MLVTPIKAPSVLEPEAATPAEDACAWVLSAKADVLHTSKRSVVLRLKPAGSEQFTAAVKVTRCLAESLQQPPELQALSRIPAHRSIVPRPAVMVLQHRVALVYPLFPHDLFDAAEAGGAVMPAAATARLVRDVMDALHHMHAHGWSHCDIKPENVLVDAAGRAVVTDFEMATQASQLPCGLTRGTLDWMAPEMTAPWNAGRQYSPQKADVWACGQLALFCMTRHGVSLNATHTEMEWREDLLHRAGADSSCLEFLRGVLAPDPGKRWTAAVALQHPWLARA